MSDAYRIYPTGYVTLCIIEMTGHQLKILMEWGYSSMAAMTSNQVLWGVSGVSYEYDNMQFKGINYRVDRTQPGWSRIVEMKNPDGTHFDLDAVYFVTADSYTTDYRLLSDILGRREIRTRL